MKRIRKGIKLKDAINCSVLKEFTQIPNAMLRNPEISGKAKAILCLLLSNSDGWSSYVDTIISMMKEEKDAIASGLHELEYHGYLLRMRYRDTKTKSFKGVLWAYTDTPNTFNIEASKQLLKALNYELMVHQSHNRKIQDMGNPEYGKPVTKNTNIKRKKIKKNYSLSQTHHQSTKEYLTIARKLSKIVRRIKNIKHTHSQLVFWANHIRLLVERNKVSTDRIYQVLKWYEKHHADKYTPVIESGASLRSKFIKLEDAIKRGSENNYISKALSVEELHEQIKNRMNGVGKDTTKRMAVVFDNVCNLAPNIDKVSLINNLNDLYLNIIQSRPKDAMERSIHGDDIGTPIYLIEEYYQWLKDSTWINDINENTIAFKSKLFKKFLNYFGDEIGLDPLTGDFK